MDLRIIIGCFCILACSLINVAGAFEFTAEGVCYKNEDTKFEGPVHSQSSAANENDCCNTCHRFLLGFSPCAGFRFKLGICYILSKITAIVSETGTVSGKSAQQLYTIKRKNVHPDPASAPVIASSTEVSARHCGQQCLQTMQCRSFSYMQSNNNCELMNTIENDTISFSVRQGDRYYELYYNFPENIQPVDCTYTNWTTVGNCTLDETFCNVLPCTFNCSQQWNRTILTPAYHGGLCAFETSKTTLCNGCVLGPQNHVLIAGGRTSAGISNQLINLVLETQQTTPLTHTLAVKREFHTMDYYNGTVCVHGGRASGSNYLPNMELLSGLPLATVQSVASGKHVYACGGVTNHKYYSCFGWGNAPFNYPTTCDVFDLQQNYAHSVLQITNVSGRAFSACAFNDNYLYMVAGNDMASWSSQHYLNETVQIDLETEF